MQVTCPKCRALAERTYDPPLLRRTKCPSCGYELEEINAKEVLKIADILGNQVVYEIERPQDEVFRQYKEYQEKWLERHEGICTPLWCRPIPKDKIPPEGYWREPGTLREWLTILGVKDIDAAEKKVRETGPYNQWQETAWDMWKKGEI